MIIRCYLFLFMAPTMHTRTLGSISAALSCLVCVPPRGEGRSAGSFPEQRLVIEPNTTAVEFENGDFTLKTM